MIRFRSRFLASLVLISSTTAGVARGQGTTSKYLVKHPYKADLNANQVLRGQWSYSLDAVAVSRSGGRVHQSDKGTVGPFEVDTSESRTVTARSGALATATPNASVDFMQTSGSHQVDGSAAVSADGRYARAYSSSTLALNTGVKRAKGTIRWSPNWVVDRVSKSTHAGRDPVDLVFQDPHTGEEFSSRLFDMQFALGDGSSGSWQDGHFALQGVDGLFSLKMDSPFLTSPTGSMYLEFDTLGRVTQSKSSGVFAGTLPSVGEQAALDLDINQLVGGSDGAIDLAYDFGREGELTLNTDFSGDGMVQVYNDDTPQIVNDFSHINVNDTAHPLFGTPFESNQTERSSDLIVPDIAQDAYAGHLDLSVHGPHQVHTVAFSGSRDQAPRGGLEASFDALIEGNLPSQTGAGITMLLLPDTPDASLSVFDEALLPSNFSSIHPSADKALGVGLDVIGDGTQQTALVALSWDQQLLGQVHVPVPSDVAGSTLWNEVRLEVVPDRDVAHVSVYLDANGRQNAVPVLQQIIPAQFLMTSLRPVFATTGRDEMGVRALDNVFVDFLPLTQSNLIGDFNGDALLDVTDVNTLANAVSASSYSELYDLNRDGALDNADMLTWIQEIRHTWIGDANLDGAFDSSDLVTVFVAGTYEQDIPATWSEGDWNSDHRFDSADLIVAFQGGAYEMAPLSRTLAASAVPEPTIMWSLSGLVGVIALRRRPHPVRSSRRR